MKEGDLSRAVPQKHEQRISHLDDFREVETPHNPSDSNLFWIRGRDRVSNKTIIVDVKGLIESLGTDPERQHHQKQIVHKLKEFDERKAWNPDEFHQKETQNDGEEVSKGDEYHVKGIHEGKLIRSRITKRQEVSSSGIDIRSVLSDETQNGVFSLVDMRHQRLISQTRHQLHDLFG